MNTQKNTYIFFYPYTETVDSDGNMGRANGDTMCL